LIVFSGKEFLAVHLMNHVMIHEDENYPKPGIVKVSVCIDTHAQNGVKTWTIYRVIISLNLF